MRLGSRSYVFRPLSNADVYIVVALALSSYILFWLLESRTKGAVAAAMIGSLSVTIRLSWPLFRLASFWLLMAVLIVAHVAAYAAIKQSDIMGVTGAALIPLMFLDTAVGLSLVYLLYRLLYGRPVALFGREEGQSGLELE